MPAHDEVPEYTGHAVGGVCPFACKEGVSVYLDESLKRFRTVFPACGSANSAIELTIPELEQYSGCDEWVDVCKDWQPQNKPGTGSASCGFAVSLLLRRSLLTSGNQDPAAGCISCRRTLFSCFRHYFLIMPSYLSFQRFS